MIELAGEKILELPEKKIPFRSIRPSLFLTRLALSISPDGKRLINSTPLNGVVVG
jgi:hypothetical protein